MVVIVEPPHRRLPFTYKPQWQRFMAPIQTENIYQRQYAHVHHQRLAVLGPQCQIASDNVVRVQRLLELQASVESFVVGTVVVVTEEKGTKEYFLEDESGRVTLELEDDKSTFYCTGLVIGVKGRLREMDGVFVVTEVVYPSSSVTQSMQVGSSTTSGGPTANVLILSGLDCANDETSSLPREMLLCLLQGRLGEDTLPLARSITHVLLVGGLVATSAKSKSNNKSMKHALQDLDAYLLQLAATGVRIDVVPGEFDPTTANWPQRPLHPSLLPRATFNYSTIHCAPNPMAAQYGERRWVATDGRNIRDLMANADKEMTELQALQLSLRARHICPTGPDSVPTIPHAESDPMALTKEDSFDVYLCGGASEFVSCIQEGTRLVGVPNFGTTGQAVVCNLDSLDVEVLRFEA